jgi:hypothetical protein
MMMIPVMVLLSRELRRAFFSSALVASALDAGLKRGQFPPNPVPWGNQFFQPNVNVKNDQ